MADEAMIADYLSKGYKGAQVASFCGVSEPYITQLMKDEKFRELLRGKMIENVDERIGNRYSDLEEVTIKAIKDNIATADMGDLTRVLESIVRIKNTSKHVPVDALRNPTMGITLVFNQNNQPQLVTDGQNRIVAIGDNTMVPMPAKAVRSLFEGMKKEEVADVSDAIPSSEELKSITAADLAA